jgi:hypothetical protein
VATRRKTPAWFLSIGLHLAIALVIGCLWIAQAVEEQGACTLSTRCPSMIPDCIPPKGPAEEHPPIVPEKFVVDPVILNDAEAVVVNTLPENEERPFPKGESNEFLDSAPFRGKSINAAIGVSGGAGGRHGEGRSRFG